MGLQKNFRYTVVGTILSLSKYSEFILLIPLITTCNSTTRINWGQNLMLAIGLSWSVGMKIGWPRPPSDLWLDDVTKRFSGPGARFGFPSGDALAYGAILPYIMLQPWYFLYPYDKIVKFMLFICVFTWIVFGRVYLGVHYLGDTLGGVIIGLFLGSLLLLLGQHPHLLGILIILLALLGFLTAKIYGVQIDWPRLLIVFVIGMCFAILGNLKYASPNHNWFALIVSLMLIGASYKKSLFAPLSFLWALLYPYIL